MEDRGRKSGKKGKGHDSCGTRFEVVCELECDLGVLGDFLEWMGRRVCADTGAD